MAYDIKTWRARIAERTDVSTQIVHLTREREGAAVAKVLFEIIESGRLKGSSSASGFICGNRPAVCFQDAPLVSICQNVYYEQKYRQSNPNAKNRYRAVGLAFSKPYASRKGARPVIYDKTSEAKQYLPPDQWWRIVNFDLGNDESFIDWTHEREWRAPGDFEFDLAEATLLFVNESTYRSFEKLCKTKGRDYLERAKGVVVMNNLLY
ncbi:MAG: DUF2971 domain-containing protein [Burkholderiales bacterium PBB3]|nr:MAG: DUF2971 domain-containing protein [Burkholderiales bacterium PBB3]